MRFVLLPILFVLAACEALPRDPEGTLARVTKTRTLHVGIVGGEVAPRASSLLSALGAETKARPSITHGASDPLLALLERGELDLVIGPFAKDSPLASEVAFGPALAIYRSGDSRTELKAAMRNGENRWIMRVESASRRAASEAAAP